MSHKKKQERLQAGSRKKRALQVERLEDRQLLTTVTEFPLSNDTPRPVGITSGSDGNLWFTESNTDEIGKITPSGTITTYALTSGSGPQYITNGPSGNLWFTEPGSNKIGEITTGGTLTQFSIPTSDSGAGEITEGPDGNLWFTEEASGKIGMLTPGGVFTEYAVGSDTEPYGITTGPDGKLWFTEYNDGIVGSIVPSGSNAGTITTYSLGGNVEPRGITSGSDGRLWFVQASNAYVGAITTSGTISTYYAGDAYSSLAEITSGPDGDLYFTDGAGDDVGQMTTNGTVTDISVPTSGAGGDGITTGPDGNIWFAEYIGDNIGRVNLNVAPVAAAQSFTTNVINASNSNDLTITSSSTTNLLTGATGGSGTLTVSQTGTVSTTHGSVTFDLNGDGGFVYTPTSGYTGSDSFTYTVTDGTNTSASATVTLTVDAAPVAVNDTYITPVSTTLTENAANGVLANDTDPNTDHTITANLVTAPSHGTLTLNANGSFTYIPTNGYHGTDSFQYQDVDSDGLTVSSNATVTLIVDTAPVPANDSYTTDAGTPLTISSPSSGVLTNDMAYNGDGISVASTDVGTFATGHGSITMAANGTFTYTPSGSYTGTDSFSYYDYDYYQNSASPATVTFTIHALPTGATHTYEIGQGNVLNVNAANGVLQGDTGTGSLTAVLVTGPSDATSGGFTLNTNGSFIYTPTLSFSGADSFTYKVYDGIAYSSPETVTLNVDGPPTIINQTYVVTPNTPDSVNAANGVLHGNSDTFSTQLYAYIGTNPQHGSLTWGPNDGSFTYTPNAGYHGTDTFTYYTYDGFRYSQGDGTVTLDVDSPPTVVNQSYDDVENTSLNELAGQGLLVGASQANSESLTAVDLTQPSHGTVTVNANGSFSYVPTAGYYGSDSFTYTANDGVRNGNTGTVSIYVDQPPVANSDLYNVVENTSLNKNAASGVLANDTDTDSQPLTAALVQTTAHGTLNLFQDGSFTYTPNSGYYGNDTFTYQANDGITDSAITTVTIHVDAPPVGVNDSYNAIENQTLNINAANGVLINDTQAQSESLTASLISNPAHGTLTLYQDGSFGYVPNNNYYGTDSFTYKPYDGIANGNITTVSIFVDSPPVATNDSYDNVFENTPYTVNAANGVLANDTQAQSESLTAVDPSTPTHGTVTLNADGSFTYTPTSGYYGTDSFTYYAYDGHTDSLTPATVTLLVDATPVAVADNYEVLENGSLNPSAPGVIANDTQAQDSTLTAHLVSGPSHDFEFVLNNDGSFGYLPTNNYYGTDSFTYYDTDTAGQSSNTVTVSILVDQPPVGHDDYYSVPENTSLLYENAQNGELANDTSFMNQPLTATNFTNPAVGTIDTNSNGSFNYHLVPNYYGDVTFTYQPYDGFAYGNTTTVHVHVDATVNAVNDSYNAKEGLPLTVNAASGVLANDTQAQGETLTPSVQTQPAHGTLSLNADGSFSYTPNAQFFGTDTFTYIDNDGYQNSTLATVTINVAEDYAPTANNVSQIVGEGGITVNAPGILTGDTDSNGQPLSAILVSEPTHGSLTFNANGSYVYTPNSSFGSAGTDSFTFRTFDNVLTSAIATVTLTFDGNYDAPTADSQTYTVQEGSSLTQSTPGLLTGAADYWNLPLTAVIATEPTHGTLTPDDNNDGGFTYTPTAGYHGTDSFTYEASNSHTDSSAETVTINVSQSYGAPTATNDSYTTNESTTLTENAVAGVLANDTDPNSLPLSAILVTNPTHGSVQLNGNGSFVYTPVAGYYGTDTFTYKDSDGQAYSNNATVTLTIAQVYYPPTAINQTYTVPAGLTLTESAPGVLAGDTDPNSLSLNAQLFGEPSHDSSFTFNNNGSFTYVPTPGYFGTDSFTYKAADGQAISSLATVTITITNPLTVTGTTISATEGSAFSGNVGSFTDANPTAPIGNFTAVIYWGDTASSAGTITQPGGVGTAFEVGGSHTYATTGTLTAMIVIFDNNEISASANTTANVGTPIPVAPVAVNDSQTVGETGFTATTSGGGGDVLANDVDNSVNPLTALLVTEPSHGSLVFNSNGTYTYSPNSSFGTAGTDSFTYRAYDGTLLSNVATVTLTFSGTYLPPTAQAENDTVAEGSSLTVSTPGVLAGASDYWNLGLTAINLQDGPTHGSLTLNSNGSFTYNPTPGFYGTDTFQYEANNGHTSSTAQTVTITVAQVNSPPVAVNDSYTTAEATALTKTSLTGVLANDTDPQSLPLTAILVTNPTHGSVAFNADGSFTYTPVAGYHGADSFTYKDNDGQANSNTATVNLTVTQVYYPPTVVNQTYTIPNGETLTVSAPGILTGDTDPNSLTLNAQLVTPPTNGAINSISNNGAFVYTPHPGFVGTDTFTYKATDGQASSSVATVTITVTNPMTVTGTTASATEGTVFTGNVGSFTDVNTMVPIDAFTAVIEWGDTSTSAGTITQPGGAGTAFEVSGTHTYETSGQITATVLITDFNENSASATTSFNVTSTSSQPPVAVNQSYTTPEGSPLTTTTENGLLVGDTDSNSQPLTALLVSSPTHGNLSFKSDGTFTYIPNNNFSGTDTFTYEANDGTSNSDLATVTLNITPVDLAPVAVNDNYSTPEGATLTTSVLSGVLVNDTDNSPNPLTAVLVTNPTNGTLTLNTDGSFTYVPNPLFYGTDTFTYEASDGTHLSQPATVLLGVTEVFEPPVVLSSTFSTSETTTLDVNGVGVLAGATDSANLPLTASVVSEPTHGTLTLNANGSFTYVPEGTFTGTDSFTFKAADGENDSNVATVTLDVMPIDQAPVAVADQYTTTSGQTLTVPASTGVLANDTDNSANPLTAVVVSQPAHGTLVLNANGSFTYTPEGTFSGVDRFMYVASDGQMESQAATVTLTINPAQVAPKPTPVAGDYFGTGKADPAVYLVNQGAFAIQNPETGADVIVPFGTPGAGQTIPAPGDYFGTGLTDIAAYLPSQGIYAIRNPAGGPDQLVSFGIKGAGQTIPAPGDYFGTGVTDIAVYLTSIGAFAIRNPAGGPDEIIPFGTAGLGNSIPVPGDYDGSGKTELAVYMPSLGEFAYRPANGGPDVIVKFGMAGAGNSIPIPGDYDGSGKTEFAVYMPSLAEFAYRPANGGPDVVEPFGIAGAGQTLPEPGDYTGVGHDELAAYLPNTATFAIRPGGGQPDVSGSFGAAGLGQTIPVTVVDQAIAELPPSTVTTLSIEIPDTSATTQAVIFPTTSTKTKKKKQRSE